MDLNLLFFCSFVGIGLASLPFWWNAYLRKQAGDPILESRETISSPFGFTDIVLMFFFWLFGQFSALGIATLALGLDPTKLSELDGTELAWLTIIASVGQLIVTAIAMSTLYARYRSWAIFGFTWSTLRQDLKLGGIAFLMVVPATLVVQLLLTQFLKYNHNTLEMLANNVNALTVSAAWFGAVLVAPICEEIFFRGVLQGWLHRVFTSNRLFSDQNLIGGWDRSTGSADEQAEAVDSTETEHKNFEQRNSDNPYASPTNMGLNYSATVPSEGYWAIFVSAAIFGLAHLGQGPAPIPLFLFGLALGYIYHKTGSVFPCIVLHMLLNGFSMFWFTINTFFSPAVETTPVEPIPATVTGFIEPITTLLFTL
ncbi:MAG: lysostaphin resistance A-like protein [Mariniblastus sp.]